MKFSMLMLMGVRMAMDKLFMAVGMLMNQVRPHQEFGIGKKFLRWAIGDNIMVRSQNQHPGGDLLHHIHVLSAEDQAVPAS